MYNKKVRNLYSLEITKIIKSKGMNWTEHVAHMGRSGVHRRILWENLMERGHYGVKY
jgi:hypothetical protein